MHREPNAVGSGGYSRVGVPVGHSQPLLQAMEACGTAISTAQGVGDTDAMPDGAHLDSET